MKQPVWIEIEDCLAFHAELVSRFGGADGIRDEGLLDLALNRPLQASHYGEPAFFEIAASYAAGIVKNHPFVDGNKRAGLMAAALFLELNGFVFEAPEEEAVLHTLALAAGELDEGAFAQWHSRSCSKRS